MLETLEARLYRMEVVMRVVFPVREECRVWMRVGIKSYLLEGFWLWSLGF